MVHLRWKKGLNTHGIATRHKTGWQYRFTIWQNEAIVAPSTRAGLNAEALEVNDPKELQYDEYDGNYDQRMDPTAGLRETWTYIPAEKAEQPEYDQNNDNCPQHDFSPFE